MNLISFASSFLPLVTSCTNESDLSVVADSDDIDKISLTPNDIFEECLPPESNPCWIDTETGDYNESCTATWQMAQSEFDDQFVEKMGVTPQEFSVGDYTVLTSFQDFYLNNSAHESYHYKAQALFLKGFVASDLLQAYNNPEFENNYYLGTQYLTSLTENIYICQVQYNIKTLSLEDDLTSSITQYIGDVPYPVPQVQDGGYYSHRYHDIRPATLKLYYHVYASQDGRLSSETDASGVIPEPYVENIDSTVNPLIDLVSSSYGNSETQIDLTGIFGVASYNGLYCSSAGDQKECW